MKKIKKAGENGKKKLRIIANKRKEGLKHMPVDSRRGRKNSRQNGSNREINKQKIVK